VTNAFEPADPGTLIDDAPARSSQVEILTALDVFALEVFEQDMVGVKGYDATILQILTGIIVSIVAKTSNANSITHFVEAPPKLLKRVENDIVAEYPTASVTVQGLSVVAAIGRDLSGLNALGRGLAALERAGVALIAVQQGPRNVDIQFVVMREDAETAVRALHEALIEQADGRAHKSQGATVKNGSRLAA